MQKKKKDQQKPQGNEVFINLTGDQKKDRQNLDFALRDFKKKVKKSGILNDLRRRESYMSPSKYKTWRRNEALKRRKRDEKKQDWSHNQLDS